MYVLLFVFLKNKRPGLLERSNLPQQIRGQVWGWRVGKAPVTDHFHKSHNSGRAFGGMQSRKKDDYQVGKHFRVMDATSGKGARKLVCTVEIF